MLDVLVEREVESLSWRLKVYGGVCWLWEMPVFTLFCIVIILDL